MAESLMPCRSEARERLTAGVLSWLAAGIAFFDPPQEDEVLDAAPEDIEPGPRRKAFGELGLAIRVANRVPELRARPELRSLSEAWVAMAQRRNIFFDARRRVHLVPLMAVALVVLADLGRADDAARRALQSVLDRRFFDRTERSAWGQIDVAYYLDELGLRHAFPDSGRLYRRSSLVAPPAVPHALRIDLYAATHLVFHLSDFGGRPLPAASRRETAQIRDYLSLALSTCMAERDWDLVGELLAARFCLGAGADGLGEAAIASLVEAQQPSGFIPDVSWQRGLDLPTDLADRAAMEFAAVYHPTLVVLIMLACQRRADLAQLREIA